MELSLITSQIFELFNCIGKINKYVMDNILL